MTRIFFAVRILMFIYEYFKKRRRATQARQRQKGTASGSREAAGARAGAR